MRQPRILLVGIAGGTASGKTTLSRRFAETQPNVLLIGHDRYYITVPDPHHHNYDEPAALESSLLARHLDELLRGRPVILPRYLYTSHQRDTEGDPAGPALTIVVEGILVLTEPLLRDRFHLKVWVDAPDDVRLIRRIRRDVVQRGRSVENILDQYEYTVRPSHVQWVAPAARVADLVLDGTAPVDDEVERLRFHVEEFRTRRA